MSTIIAGHFETQPQIAEAMAGLKNAGFPAERVAWFYVNPPGQHDAHPLGGDYDKSPGAEDTGKGVTTGIAAGATAGIAAVPVLGPAGPLLGAYVGSLVGTLASTKDGDEMAPQEPHEHPPGLMLAVAVDGQEQQRAIDMLRRAGGSGIEIADGTIRDGNWVDFDPLATPRLVGDEPGSTP
jgi:phage tail tape-measure protein